MATDDALQRFLASTEPEDYQPGEFEPGDTSRMSVEAFIASATGTARELSSSGSLRLHGAAVIGNTAALADVGLIASAWQKLVSAVGAALEDIRSIRGQLPADIITRTTLVLSASPAPGSVILRVQPKADPFLEVAPDGAMPLMDEPRPLADKAAEALIKLLAEAVVAGPAALEGLSESMRDLGPRVGSSLLIFADSLAKSNITLGATWREPTHPTLRAEVTPVTAKWLKEFVAGRDLDAEVIEMTGVLRTISDADKWLVEVDDKQLRMDATELDPSSITRFHVSQRVRLSVRTSFREQPDGRTTPSYRILEVFAGDG
jgi:hypothetical protein